MHITRQIAMVENDKKPTNFQLQTNKVSSGSEESKTKYNPTSLPYNLPPIEEYLLQMQNIINKNELPSGKLEKLKEIKSRYEPCQEHESTSCDLPACRLSRLPDYSPGLEKSDLQEKKKCRFDKAHQETSDTIPIDERIQRIRDRIDAGFEDFEKRYRNRLASSTEYLSE